MRPILSQKIIDGADSFPLLAIPFFLLAGELMNAGGISRRIVNFALAWVGHIRGGLGLVAILPAVIMAALSGSRGRRHRGARRAADPDDAQRRLQRAARRPA